MHMLYMLNFNYTIKIVKKDIFFFSKANNFPKGVEPGTFPTPVQEIQGHDF